MSVNSDDDEGDAVEVDVCLRGFSTVMLGCLPSKVNFCSSFSLLSIPCGTYTEIDS